MLNDLLMNSSIADSITLSSVMIILVSSFILGLMISAVYVYSKKNDMSSNGFSITLILLPTIIAMIIFLIGSNVARAFSLAGAFSLIRFRSAPADAKDISFVFFSLGVGLACGMGFIAYALLFALFVCLIMLVITKLNIGFISNHRMRLKIVMPEDINYQDAFDDILKQFTIYHKLIKIKTTDFGSLFELTYELKMKDAMHSKEFIDCIRCKNGNLNVILTMQEQTDIAS